MLIRLYLSRCRLCYGKGYLLEGPQPSIYVRKGHAPIIINENILIYSVSFLLFFLSFSIISLSFSSFSDNQRIPLSSSGTDSMQQYFLINKNKLTATRQNGAMLVPKKNSLACSKKGHPQSIGRPLAKSKNPPQAMKK